jgi:UDP-glucose 4-epimerase
MDAARSSVDMLADQYANSNVILTGTQTLRIGEVMETIAEILGTRPELVFRNKTDNGHYAKTCYAYIPDKAYKYVPAMQIDFAQGLLEAIHDAHEDDDETPARRREQGAA